MMKKWKRKRKMEKKGKRKKTRGTFTEPSRNRQSLCGTSRNLHGTLRNLGTLPAREILKKTIAEPCSRNLAEPSQQRKSSRKPLWNLAQLFAELAQQVKFLEKTIAEPSRNFCGSFAEPSQQGKSIRKPLRNLVEPSRNLLSLRGTLREP